MNRHEKISCEQRFLVFERDGFRCVYCGKSAMEGAYLSVAFHADHFYPRNEGGMDVDDNLVTACSDCNIGKSDRVIGRLPPGIPNSVREHFVLYAQGCRVVPEIENGSPPMPRLPAWDREVLEVLVGVPDSVGLIVRQVGTSGVDSREARTVLAAAERLHSAGRQVALSDLLLDIDDQAVRSLLIAARDRSAADGRARHERIHYLKDALRRRSAERQSHASARTLKTSRLDAQSEAELLERLVAERRAAQGMTSKTEANNGR